MPREGGDKPQAVETYKSELGCRYLELIRLFAITHSKGAGSYESYRTLVISKFSYLVNYYLCG
jgi:hypothetical protein